MRTLSFLAKFAILPMATAFVTTLNAQAPLYLQLRSDAQGWTIAWPARLRDAQGAEQSPTYELQQSDDLTTWGTVGSPFQAAPGSLNDLVIARMPTDALQGFYRVVAHFPS